MLTKSMNEIILQFFADWLVIPMIIIGGATMLRLPKDRWLEMASMGGVAALLALWLAKLGSVFYQGERPFERLGEEPGAAFLNNPGFPSDHALLVFIIAFVIWASTKNKPLSILLLILGALVSSARVLALVHSPIDVVGSLIFAFIACAAIYGKSFFTSKKML